MTIYQIVYKPTEKCIEAYSGKSDFLAKYTYKQFILENKLNQDEYMLIATDEKMERKLC